MWRRAAALLYAFDLLTITQRHIILNIKVAFRSKPVINIKNIYLYEKN